MTETTHNEGSPGTDCYAFRGGNGVDIDSISETPDGVRDRMLEGVMGWRYQYPDRYPHEEAWQRILKTGTVVNVSVTEIDEVPRCPDCDSDERETFTADYDRCLGCDSLIDPV